MFRLLAVSLFPTSHNFRCVLGNHQTKIEKKKHPPGRMEESWTVSRIHPVKNMEHVWFLQILRPSRPSIPAGRVWCSTKLEPKAVVVKWQHVSHRGKPVVQCEDSVRHCENRSRRLGDSKRTPWAAPILRLQPDTAGIDWTRFIVSS